MRLNAATPRTNHTHQNPSFIFLMSGAVQAQGGGGEFEFPLEQTGTLVSRLRSRPAAHADARGRQHRRARDLREAEIGKAGSAYAEPGRLRCRAVGRVPRSGPARRRSLPTARRRRWRLLNRHQADPVAAALVDHQVAVRRRAHVPDDPVARRNRPALELLGLRVEAHERVGPAPRFVVPDDVVDDLDRVGMRIGPARRRPFLDLARLRIEAPERAERLSSRTTPCRRS